MAIKESALSLITSIAQGDWVRAVTSAGASRRVTVADLAKAIVETYTGSSLAGSAQSVKAALDSLNSNKVGGRTKQVTLGANHTASVSDIINAGECGILLVQQNAFTLNNLGYATMVRRINSTFYISDVSFSGTETLRPSLDSSGILSVANTQYSGQYRCLFIPF